MRLATPGFSPLQSIFGAGYLAEQSGDELRRHLPPRGDEDAMVDFGEILKALRTALSLR